MMEQEINILDYYKVIDKWREFIISFTAAVVVITVLISLMIPWKYKAEATLIIPQQSGKGMESIMAFSSMMSGSSMSIPTDITQSMIGRTTNFSDILQSRTLAAMIVDGLDLKRHYRRKSREALIAMVQRKIKVNEQKSIIKVYVVDRNPRLAADIVNYSALALDEFNKKGNMQFAKRLKVFVRDQLATAKVDLSDAEEKLKKFETQSQMVKISEKEILYARLMRDVKVKEAIYTMLMQEYERSRIDEAKEELFFEVLDPATTPKSPYFPKPFKFSLIAIFLGGTAAVFLSFFFEYLEAIGIKVPRMDFQSEVTWIKTRKFLTR